MSGKNFLFGKYSFSEKYAAEKAFFKTDFCGFLFLPRTLWDIDILAIISASKAFLWRSDFLCVSIACDLNRSDATPENLSVLFWRFVTPCFGCFVTFVNTWCRITRRGNRWCLLIAIIGGFLTFVYWAFRPSWFTEISINSRLAWSGFSFAYGYSINNNTLWIRVFFTPNATPHLDLADTKTSVSGISQKAGAAHCIIRFVAESAFQV